METRPDHIFMESIIPRWLQGDTGVLVFYITAEAIVTGMFVLMYLNEESLLTLLGACGGFAVLAVLLALLLRMNFDAFLMETAVHFRPGRRRHFGLTGAYSLMPRLNPYELVRGSAS